MKCSPASAKKCVSLAAWYEPLLHLIIVQPEDEFEVTSEPDVMQEELAEVTLEIIHIGMWKGIDGSDIAVWKVGISCQAGNLFYRMWGCTGCPKEEFTLPHCLMNWIESSIG